MTGLSANEGARASSALGSVSSSTPTPPSSECLQGGAWAPAVGSGLDRGQSTGERRA